MFSLTVLGSGSAGNCAVVRSPNCALLIDGGLSARQITTRLETAGLSLENLDGILLTHEHIDHVAGLEVLCRKHPVPIFCNSMTAAMLREQFGMHPKDWRIFATGQDFAIKDITVETFPVCHDAVEPVGFMLHHGKSALGFLTDLGWATKLVMERVRRSHTLVIEANHDEQLLQKDLRRPWPVKQRIMSRHGHLSNAAAGEVVRELLEHGLRRVVLGHLSRDCNTPELAVAAVQSVLSGATDVDLFCATQREATSTFVIGALAETGEMLPDV